MIANWWNWNGPNGVRCEQLAFPNGKDEIVAAARDFVDKNVGAARFDATKFRILLDSLRDQIDWRWVQPQTRFALAETVLKTQGVGVVAGAAHTVVQHPNLRDPVVTAQWTFGHAMALGIVFDGVDFYIESSIADADAWRKGLVQHRTKFDIPHGNVREGYWFFDPNTHERAPFNGNTSPSYRASTARDIESVTGIAAQTWETRIPRWMQEMSLRHHTKAARISYIEQEFQAGAHYTAGQRDVTWQTWPTTHRVRVAYLRNSKTGAEVLYDGHDFFVGGSGPLAAESVAAWSRYSPVAYGTGATASWLANTGIAAQATGTAPQQVPPAAAPAARSTHQSQPMGARFTVIQHARTTPLVISELAGTTNYPGFWEMLANNRWYRSGIRDAVDWQGLNPNEQTAWDAWATDVVATVPFGQGGPTSRGNIVESYTKDLAKAAPNVRLATVKHAQTGGELLVIYPQQTSLRPVIVYDGYDFFIGQDEVAALDCHHLYTSWAARLAAAQQATVPPATPAKKTKGTTVGDPLQRDADMAYLVVGDDPLNDLYAVDVNNQPWVDFLKARCDYQNLVTSLQKAWDDLIDEMWHQGKVTALAKTQKIRFDAIEREAVKVEAAYTQRSGGPTFACGRINPSNLGDVYEIGLGTPNYYYGYDGHDWFGGKTLLEARALARKYTRVYSGTALTQAQTPAWIGGDAPVWADLLDAAGKSAEGAPTSLIRKLIDAGVRSGTSPLEAARGIARILGAANPKKAVRVIYTEDGRPFGLAVLPVPANGLLGAHVIWTKRIGWQVSDVIGIFRLARGAAHSGDTKVSGAPFEMIFGPNQDALIFVDFDPKVTKFSDGSLAFQRQPYSKQDPLALVRRWESMTRPSRTPTAWILRGSPLIGEHYARIGAPGVTVDQPAGSGLAGLKRRR